MKTMAEETKTASTPVVDTTSNQPAASGNNADGTPIGSSAVSVQTNETPATGDKKETPAADWRTVLPEDIRTEKTFESFKDAGALAKSYLELRKMQGASIRKPEATASKEEWDSFYEKLGWEKDAEKVAANVKGPILPAGMEMKAEEVTGFTKHAHGLRMNAEQIQGVLNYYGEFVKQVIPDYKGDGEKAVTALKEDWGLATDRNMGVARRALFVDFPKETVERIERAGLANDVGFIKAMFNRGKGLIEEGIIPEEVGQGMDTKSAESKIKEMESDVKSPLWDKNHAQHNDYVERRNALYKVVYGS
jgi:hypothetical protein